MKITLWDHEIRINIPELSFLVHGQSIISCIYDMQFWLWASNAVLSDCCIKEISRFLVMYLTAWISYFLCYFVLTRMLNPLIIVLQNPLLIFGIVLMDTSNWVWTSPNKKFRTGISWFSLFPSTSWSNFQLFDRSFPFKDVAFAGWHQSRGPRHGMLGF